MADGLVSLNVVSTLQASGLSWNPASKVVTWLCVCDILCLSFLICKMGLLPVPASLAYGVD